MGGFTGLNSADAAMPMKVVWAPVEQASSLSFKAAPTAQRTSCSRSPVKASPKTPKTPREPQAQVPSASRLPRDFENKLIAADTDDDSMDGIFNKFDALGRRVGHDDGTANVVYFQDGQQTIADYPSDTAAGSPTYTYVYASYIDEPAMRGGSGGLRYCHRNQQYSITAVSDGGGSVVERYAYSAYGQVTFVDASGPEISNSAISNRFTYTGREWDNGLSLYHYRARMYDAVGGRFCSVDPMGYEDGLSMYLFVRNSPSMNVDPTGLFCVGASVSPPGLPGMGGMGKIGPIGWDIDISATLDMQTCDKVCPCGGPHSGKTVSDESLGVSISARGEVFGSTYGGAVSDKLSGGALYGHWWAGIKVSGGFSGSASGEMFTDRCNDRGLNGRVCLSAGGTFAVAGGGEAVVNVKTWRKIHHWRLAAYVEGRLNLNYKTCYTCIDDDCSWEAGQFCVQGRVDVNLQVFGWIKNRWISSGVKINVWSGETCFPM